MYEMTRTEGHWFVHESVEEAEEVVVFSSGTLKCSCVLRAPALQEMVVGAGNYLFPW